MKNKVEQRIITDQSSDENQVCVVCEKCGEREATHEHHTIFDPITNKSDKSSPIQDLCALCHAEVHGISPNMSELRMLVTEFNRVQKTRIIYDNTMRGFKHIEMKIPQFFEQQSKNLNDYEKLLSKKIKKFLDGETILGLKTIEFVSHKNRKDHGFTENQLRGVFPIYSWLKNIRGISHLLSSQLIAYIDIKKFERVSSLWHYVGMHVNNGIAPKRMKGSKIDWNPQMRMICYKISDSFIKQRTPKYREIYDKEKEKQIKLLDKTTVSVKPKPGMSKSKRKSGDHIINEPHLNLVSAPKSKGHADMRARRKAVKEFLKDFYLEWKKLELNTQEETTGKMKPIACLSPLPA